MSLSAFLLEPEYNTVCIVVGQGLVGGEISAQLRLQERILPLTAIQVGQATAWQDAAGFVKKIEYIVSTSKAENIELIWAAGRAGFSASQAMLDAEYEFYSQVITALSNLNITVNLISSAGGIYENSGRVESLEAIGPSRPYAHNKIRQENLLSELAVKFRIYRTSSVYGLGGSRVGLIQSMLRSAMYKTPMVIYANQNTLRDYIYNQDLAKHIVIDQQSNASHGIKIMASGRAISVSMLLTLIEKISDKRIFASFCPNQSNDKDIVFASSLISKHFACTSIEESIRVMHKKLHGISQYQ